MNVSTDLKVRESLTIVSVNGFEPKDDSPDGAVDLPGDANWLCEQYGMAEDCQGESGILWTDYDGGSDYPWAFDVLIDTSESVSFENFAASRGYEILKDHDVNEPRNFGDGNGTVEILKHRNGWVVLES